MIYAVCVTQVVTVVGFLIAIRWVLDHEERISQLQAQTMKNSFDTMAEVVQKSDEQVRAIIDQGHKERELLLERVQHPEQTVAQAAGVTESTSTTVMDEQKEWEDENPNLAEEQKTGVLKAVEPVQPIGGRERGGAI